MASDDDQVDREAKTPNNTGSFAAFHTESKRIAERLRTVATVKEQNPRAGWDITGAKRARIMAAEMEALADRFAAWPQLSPETVAKERAAKIAMLLDYNRECEEMASSTPGVPPLENLDPRIRRR